MGWKDGPGSEEDDDVEVVLKRGWWRGVVRGRGGRDDIAVRVDRALILGL